MISEADKRRFYERGYMLVEGVVPQALCEAVCAYLCEWLGIDGDDPATWPRARGHGIVPVHHAQPLWDLRQHPAVHEAFAALHGTEDLWVSFDRASFKAPCAEEDDGSLLAEPIHWDGDPTRLEGHSLQGLVYLRDTTPEQGAFCCVPDIYRDVTAYLRDQPESARTRRPENLDPSRIERIGGPQGSLLVWHRKMPHSSTINRTNRPRWVQYVAMDPAGSAAQRAERIEQYEQALPPQWAVVQKVPRQQIPEPDGPARLTALGRRLVGYA